MLERILTVKVCQLLRHSLSCGLQAKIGFPHFPQPRSDANRHIFWRFSLAATRAVGESAFGVRARRNRASTSPASGRKDAADQFSVNCTTAGTYTTAGGSVAGIPPASIIGFALLTPVLSVGPLPGLTQPALPGPLATQPTLTLPGTGNDNGDPTNTACGTNAQATGGNASAYGNNTAAAGAGSTAIGNNTTAAGILSTAIGAGVTTNGVASAGVGSNFTVNG